MPSLAEIVLEGGRLRSQNLLRQAEIVADSKRRSGEIWGSTIANIGANVAGAVQQHQQFKAEAPMRALQMQQAEANLATTQSNLLKDDEERKARAAADAENQAINQWMGESLLPADEFGYVGVDREKFSRRLIEAGRGAEWLKLQKGLDEADAAARRRRQDMIDDQAWFAYNVHQVGNHPQFFINDLKRAMRNGVISPEKGEPWLKAVEDNPSPELVGLITQSLMRQSKAVRDELQPKDEYVPVAAGSGVLNRRTGEVTQGIEKPETAPPVGSLQDYLTERFGPNPNAAQIRQGRREYEDSGRAGGAGGGQGDTALADSIVKNPGLWAGLTPSAKEKLIPLLSQKGFDFASTIQGGTSGVAAIVDRIAELSKNINTQPKGVKALASGITRSASAQAQYDNEVALYESMITGIIPLVAREFGHTGVLTQQDVDSVKAFFPKVTDNKELAEAKIAEIIKIINRNKSAGGGGRASGAGGAGVEVAPTSNLIQPSTPPPDQSGNWRWDAAKRKWVTR